MRDHELRRKAVSEMHLRRWPELSVPSNVVQWVLRLDDEERQEELAAINAISNNADTVGNPSHRDGSLGKHIEFARERHSEGSSLTLFAEGLGEQAFLDPSSAPDLRKALEWAQGLPGRIGDRIRSWSDCRIKDDGFGRLLVAANGAEKDDGLMDAMSSLSLELHWSRSRRCAGRSG